MTLAQIIKARNYSIQQTVKWLRETETHLNWKTRFREFYPPDMLWLSENRKKHNRPRLTQDEKKKQLIALLPAYIKTINGIICQIDTISKKQFYEEMDLSLCPAHLAKFAYYDGRFVTPDEALPSELEDYLHMVGVAYCDITFVDGSTWEILKRGHYNKLPYKNADFSRWLAELHSTY